MGLECLVSQSWVGMAFMAVGILRLINKPLFAFFGCYVRLTPWQWDNDLLARIEGSRTYRALLFLLDWVASVKIQPSKGNL